MGIAVQKIISGGQTGADRAALDCAIEKGIPHGGWCPKGRRAEDGPIDSRYALVETPTANYIQRTEWNVRDADATVIFSLGDTLSGGSKRTADLAGKHGKPCLHLSKAVDGDKAVRTLLEFLVKHGVRTLNVAGPRASNEPEVGMFVREVLDQTLSSR